ncbi:Mth938-like domain-containing protein [Advenella alkanexedens]|uniref:Mth938-like domain-containing protein n=1 Tax=Advenella alkanexedens TaxID=1481665 RepID=UPI002677605A|nr:Mth938-like domain-containing protein [Advenella alkanexedens]WKU20663.1 Mth938-like domain-containing protein [Advenella alkanexedens]
MQLQKVERSALNTVTRYGDSHIDVNDIRYENAICFKPEGPITTWPVRKVSDITTQLLELAAGVTARPSSALDFLDDNAPSSYDNAPDILLIGTGAKQVFISPQILAPLLKARIGIECMDSQAAARTYNVLMSEGRNVAVALMLNEDKGND